MTFFLGRNKLVLAMCLAPEQRRYKKADWFFFKFVIVTFLYILFETFLWVFLGLVLEVDAAENKTVGGEGTIKGQGVQPQDRHSPRMLFSPCA